MASFHSASALKMTPLLSPFLSPALRKLPVVPWDLTESTAVSAAGRTLPPHRPMSFLSRVDQVVRGIKSHGS